MGRVLGTAVTITLALSLAISGCIESDEGEVFDTQAVNNGNGAGGGGVGNVAPTVSSWLGSLSTADNSGTTVEVFTGAVFDANSENQIENLTVTITGVVAGTFTYVFTGSDRNQASEPASFGPDGFKAWTGTKNDGILNVKFRYTVPVGTPEGTYSVKLTVTDKSGATGQSELDTTLVTLFSDITVTIDPVLGGGTADTGKAWGDWSALPGATNVTSNNFIKLTNTGQALSTIVVDFSDSAFTGDANSSFSIPIDNNLRFAWAEGGATTVPDDLTFNFSGTSTDGSVAVSFTGLGNVIYIQYQVVELPDVLLDQTYSAAYTATEL